MEKKNSQDLIKKFKQLEDKLLEILKFAPIQIDEKSTHSELKKNIKKYIKKVNEAKNVFDEYEATAKEIEKQAQKNDDKEFSLSKSVVDLREIGDEIISQTLAESYGFENETFNKISEDKNEIYVNEQILVNGEHVKIKKKKNQNQKEF